MPEDLGAGRMIRKRKMQFLMGKAAGSLFVLCISPAAIAAGTSSLSGQERWQPYLDAAPQSAEEFSCAPLETILSFLPENPLRLLTQIAQNYADVFLFLLLLIVLSFLLGESRNADLLELVSAAGTGVFLWSTLAELAQRICAGMEHWKNYLTGFLPVYSGVLIAGGEANAGASACGLLLSGLCFLAQGTALWLEPLLQSYLAISMACCISSQKGLADSCRMVGSLLRKGLIWTGKLFAAVLGLQRVVTFQLDSTSLRVSRLLTGSVPVVGETLSSASETILAGLHLLKSSLGLACLAVLGAEFVPLYCTLMLHLLFLHGCALLCELSGNHCCSALLDCLEEAVRCMAAVTALFFGLTVAGVTALMLIGGG